MEAGQPITQLKDDAFEREGFAKHLASFLCLPKGAPSIVVGIEGEWGTGKTSCVNLVREVVLQCNPRPIIVEYSPWLISTLDSVIEGFFVQLAAELGSNPTVEHAKEAGKKVLSFGRMLAPIKLIPGVEPWGTVIESVLTAVGGATEAGANLADLSLQKRKRDLQDQLRKINTPIIVIIDDVDRLPPEQVRVVFQMLKTVGDFERVAYLIAYAPEPVEKALSYDGVYDGRAYLEKIVQVSYPVPRLGYLHRRKYLVDHVEALMLELGVALSDRDREVLRVAFDATELVRTFTTPRDVIRLCNHLRFSIKHTDCEVCVADLVVFETLDLTFPQVASRIRRQPELFMADSFGDPELSTTGQMVAEIRAHMNDGNSRNKKSAIETLLDEEELTGIDRERAESLLTFLFPNMSGSHGITHKTPDLSTRVRHRDALLKLLHCGVTSFTFSAKTAREFFSSPSCRRQILADYAESGNLSGWLSYLMGTAGEVPLADPSGLCDAVVEEVKGPEIKPAIESMARHIGQFFYQVMKKEREPEKRLAIMRRLVSTTASLSVSETALLCFLKEYNIWSDGRYFPTLEMGRQILDQYRTFTYEELYAAKDEWLRTVRVAAQTEDFITTQHNPLSIMYRWGQLNDNDYSEVRAFVAKHAVRPEWLSRFVGMFSMTSDAGGILYFMDDAATLKEHLANTLPHDEQAQAMVKYLDIVMKKESEAAKEADTGMPGKDSERKSEARQRLEEMGKKTVKAKAKGQRAAAKRRK